MQETKTSAVAQIGEHVGMELGTTMVKSFFDAYPTLACGHTIGREMMEKILAQPGCSGVTVFPALNESGKPTFVFTGVDSRGKTIASYPIVSSDGSLEFEEGLIVDRTKMDAW
jgi:hypothetical protein